MSIDLTGIHNVGEFYSHHYLDSLLENDLKGLFSSWKQEDDNTPDKRVDRLATEFFVAKRKAMQTKLSKVRFDAPHGIHVKLLEALGYAYKFETRYMLEGQVVPVLSVVQRDGQEYLWVVETQFPDEDQSPFGHRLSDHQFPKQEKEFQVPEETWEDLIREIFRRDEPPRWILLFAGRFVYLIDRTKWGHGKYLMFDLDEIFGRKHQDTIRALAALLAKEGLAPDEGVPLHFSLDEKSHKHAFGVSKDLKYGLRRSVELLANEYVWYQRNVGKQALFQDDEVANKLTNEALSYLYRLLFLFYAEARAGELNIVPMKSEAYQTGYSLEMLRDLEQVPLNTPQAQNGYYINTSLEKLFGLLNEGYEPSQLTLMTEQAGEQVFQEHGFTIQGLNSPLFDQAKTPMLSKAKFRNSILQEVIQLLSLSRETKRSKFGRGRISYAQLGINQLGAVYEGLLSYTGFFAQERLYEVKPAKVKESDEMGQTYFIPADKLERYEPEEFIYVEALDGTKQRKSYDKGTFIFRLAGRDREKSASYYTPEVLTECVVKYSLKELLKGKTADDILKLTICEPAMGSGAFINEAVNQLADAYLERKQEEKGEHIPADVYRHERQKVKYYLATNNAYGVDLNPTAVDLAKVSLWLNIIYDGAKMPWFGPRLAVGNSLIGARRQVYSPEDVLSGEYKKKAPEPVPLGDGEGNFARRPAGTVYHWLLPDDGMAAFDKDKVIKELAPTEIQAIKDWRKEFTKKITQAELKNLQALSDQADSLWQAHLRERMQVLSRTKEEIGIWGQSQPEENKKTLSIVGKEKELAYLERPTSPFRRLKLAMDYWCALWFWPIEEAENLPERHTFWNELYEIFKGVESDFIKPPEQLKMWGEVKPTQETIPGLATHNVQDLVTGLPRLGIVDKVSNENKFNHWELVFINIFADNCGFDLSVGNPPWVLFEFSEKGLLTELQPLIEIRNYNAGKVRSIRKALLKRESNKQEYLFEFSKQTGGKEFFGASMNYFGLAGKTNLYKCFLIKTWDIGSEIGTVGMLHPEGVFDDPKGGILRERLFTRLFFHFQFHNELKLFSEVAHAAMFSINIYSAQSSSNVSFYSIVNLFHPHSIENSLNQDGLGETPGIKDANDNWEVKGHKNRVIKMSEKEMKLFSLIFENGETETLQTRFPLVHSTEILSVFEKISTQKQKLGELSKNYFITPTTFWNETTSQQNNYLERNTHYPSRISDFVFSGPHVYVATPFKKTPNEFCKSHGDYSEINLLEVSDNYMPRTNYLINYENQNIHEVVPVWNDKPLTSYFRQAFRAMLNPAISRTLIGAILPKGASHINALRSIAFRDNKLLILISGLSSSIIYDFIIKSTGKQNLFGLFDMFPVPPITPFMFNAINNRVLRLNCVTNHYAELWETQASDNIIHENWSLQDNRLSKWNNLSINWTNSSPLRSSFERRLALVELDILIALSLNLTLLELLTVYKVQFSVLEKLEKRLLYDQRGTKVPVKTVRGELIVNEEHEDFPEMVPPFTPVDREEDYRQAWTFFEKYLNTSDRSV
jgi:hypothetical protein